MSSLGGYFELELRKGKEYHKGAIRLNSGRNALEYILRLRNYSNVFIPYYSCSVILEPIKKLRINYTYYSIDRNLEPIFNYTNIQDDEGFMYINYFGIKDKFINKLANSCRNLIIDNSQAFFSKPISEIDTFYSPRKFFGVPDGAYLYTNGVIKQTFPIDVSLGRLEHLLKRIEYGPEVGYIDFKINDQKLIAQPIMRMSNLTMALLFNIDYKFAIKRRRENYLAIHQELSEFNEIKLLPDEKVTPMVYPFLYNKLQIRKQLINEKIYVATYWSNVLEDVGKGSFEYELVNGLVPLPIDQRIKKIEIEQIIKKVKQHLCL